MRSFSPISKLCITAFMAFCMSLILSCSPSNSLYLSGASAGAKRTTSVGLLAVDIDSSIDHSARSVDLLLETQLRAEGFNLHEIDGSSLQEQLTNSRESGLRYAVSGKVLDWRPQDQLGARPRVSLELTIHDLQQSKVLWNSKESGIGSIDNAVTAIASRVIADLVERMPFQQMAPGATAPVLQAASKASPRASISQLAAQVDSGEANFLYTANQRAMPGRSVAFFYGDKPPVEQLAQFDKLILEADAINETELEALTEYGAIPYAYLSVGEVGPHRSYSSRIRPKWVLGKNNTWNSKVLDVANSDWRKFLLQRVEVLHNAGYQGLFLDTMDSYQLYASTAEARDAQERGLIDFLKLVKERYPDMRLIANRGFEILDAGAEYLEAVAAESLYASWDNNAQTYIEVEEDDRQWLLGHLNKVRDQHELDVIVIDYVPPSRRKEAKAVAKVIAAHGFIPWVSTPALNYVGIGLLEPLPRKVLMLYDREKVGSLYFSTVHTLLATPLEYMGYVPIYHDISSEGLPDAQLRGAYAAVAIAAQEPIQHSGFQDWMETQINDGLPLIALGHPGFNIDQEIAEKLGLGIVGDIDKHSAKVTHLSSMIAYEKGLPPRVDGFAAYLQNRSDLNEVHLTYSDADSNSVDPVISGPWGAMALHPAAFISDHDGIAYWLIDPFEFLGKALGNSPIPMPDVTTENGKRLFFAHIDGDALPSWAELPGRRLGAEVIKEEVLEHYQLPHTVSIVEGEMTEFPQHIDRLPRMYQTARDIFAMPNIEIATHTYSHPFKWQKVAGHEGSGKYNLNIPGYQFSPEREAAGSADFINRNLAPEGKKTEVFLWSGDALPSERMLAAVKKSGLINLNGGNTRVTRSEPALSLVSPMARPVGDHLQVYAPIMNENVYTNDWLGPFDGYRRVIETLEMTEHPRRLKPINIYYHFYIGTKTASLRSLHEVYDWSINQDIFPIYVSDYAVKVPDFRRAGIGRYLDGTWKAIGLGSVRSLRMLDSDLLPDLSNSKHIVGATRLHDGVYLHTDGAEVVTFRTTDEAITLPHLVSANGAIAHWSQSDNAIRFRVKGRVPVQIELGGSSVQACGVHAGDKVIKGSRTASGNYLYKFSTQDTGDVRINCQA